MKKFMLLLSLSLMGFVYANEEVCVGAADDTFVADPTSCEGYYLCRDEVGLPGTCPYDLWFDPVNIWCTYPGDFCGAAANPCTGATDGSFVDNPSSCGAWYYCSGGEAYPGVCANDLYFDPVNQVCTYPDYVECTSTPEEPALHVREGPPTVFGKPYSIKVAPVQPREVA
ncbi:peritrophin-44-like [Lutzomyia longipalpis]|uniref:Putative chitin binding peritrophin-a domain protein n=1 Tax=Lutzomyia longipalpis TaxID=7200 RepID=A0A1B0C9A3_LUTLO|nr:peritrophin-44-like [Lutzomyia longipalpis]